MLMFILVIFIAAVSYLIGKYGLQDSIQYIKQLFNKEDKHDKEIHTVWG